MKADIEYTYLHVKPAHEDVPITDPSNGRDLPKEGLHVPNDKFWRRRLAEGVVVEVPASAKKKSPSQTEGN